MSNDPWSDDKWASYENDTQRWIAAMQENDALRDEVNRLRHLVRHGSPDMISCSCGAIREPVEGGTESTESLGFLDYLTGSRAALVRAQEEVAALAQETDPRTCTHDDHKPCRDRACFFFGMDHCHPGD